MAASDFRLDIDLGKTLGIPKIGGGAVKPGSGIFTLPSMVNMANVAFKGIGVISDFKMQAAQAKLQTATAEHEYWTRYASVNAQNYRNYELQLDSWYRQADYAERRRQYEEQLAEQRAVYKGEVATATTRDFQRKLADLEGRFYEEEARETIELENIRTQAIGRAAKVAASGQVGRSTVGMRTAFNQQWLSNVSNRQMTRKFRIADKLNAGEALNAARQSTVNQIQFYNPVPRPNLARRTRAERSQRRFIEVAVGIKADVLRGVIAAAFYLYRRARLITIQPPHRIRRCSSASIRLVQ